MKPLNNHIVIKPIKKEVKETTESGLLHLPPTAIEQDRKQSEERPTEGVAVLVHDDSKVSIGDTVIFEKMSVTTPLNLDGEELLIINEKHLLFIK